MGTNRVCIHFLDCLFCHLREQVATDAAATCKWEHADQEECALVRHIIWNLVRSGQPERIRDIEGILDRDLSWSRWFEAGFLVELLGFW